ncbi:MAG TPA: hypothetical protein GXX29_05415 [Firmicutes bacterium]|nr:hypothetical protein [Bacillota bacterium]
MAAYYIDQDHDQDHLDNYRDEEPSGSLEPGSTSEIDEDQDDHDGLGLDTTAATAAIDAEISAEPNPDIIPSGSGQEDAGDVTSSSSSSSNSNSTNPGTGSEHSPHTGFDINQEPAEPDSRGRFDINFPFSRPAQPASYDQPHQPVYPEIRIPRRSGEEDAASFLKWTSGQFAPLFSTPAPAPMESLQELEEQESEEQEREERERDEREREEYEAGDDTEVTEETDYTNEAEDI